MAEAVYDRARARRDGSVLSVCGVAMRVRVRCVYVHLAALFASQRGRAVQRRAEAWCRQAGAGRGRAGGGRWWCVWVRARRCAAAGSACSGKAARSAAQRRQVLRAVQAVEARGAQQ